MIRFFVGKAYHDISGKLRNDAAERIKNASEPLNILYIVPDQFEYETEKAVYHALKAAGIPERGEQLRVTTFSALSEEIIRLCSDKRRIADDIMKNIIMHRVIKQNKNLLSAFGCIAEKPGFCRKMVQTVTMLKTAGITPADLSEESINSKLKEAESNPEALHSMKEHAIVTDKLRDVGLLYLAYNTRLTDTFLDKLDFTQTAAEKIADGAVDIFDGAQVYIDGFNDFTNSQLHFLANVFDYAEDVTLGFHAELADSGNEDRDNVFLTIRSQISRLYEYAQLSSDRNGAQPPVVITEGFDVKTNSPALRELSDKLFGSVKLNADISGAADVMEAADIYEELDMIAAKIRELTADGGMRYSDIAVLCADPNQYKSVVRSAFLKYDIPYFADIPEPILHQPLVTLVTSLLALLNEFSVDNVLSYVKTGFLQKYSEEKKAFVGLTKTDINAFENYIYEWAVSDDTLKKPFTLTDDAEDEVKYSTENAEQVRRAVVEPVLKLRRRLEGKSGSEITELLFMFLKDEIGIERAIANRVKSSSFSENGRRLNDSAMVRSYQKLWDTLSGVFDKLYTGLKDDILPLKDYAQLFTDICAGTALAKPPQQIDTVLVGDIDRTRTGNVRAVFIAGALDGAFPSAAVSEGVFSPFETELIRENITHITENSKKEYCLKSAKEQYCLSLFRAYRAISLPSDYLCLSYPAVTPSGADGERSEAAVNILSIAGRHSPIKASALGEEFYCRTVRSAKQRYSARMYADDPTRTAIREALCEHGEQPFLDKLDKLRELRETGTEQRISPAAARLLFPKKISATKIEKLDLCKFQFFCEVGLGITEPVIRTFNRLQRGNVVHYCMENILKKYMGSMNDFFSLTRAQLFSLVKEELERYRKSEMLENFAGDKRVAYLFDNIATIATDMLVMTQAEFFSREYRPKFFELSLNESTLPVPEEKAGGIPEKLPDAKLYDDAADPAPEPAGIPAESGTLNVAPLSLDIGGEKITVTGKIDRVDMFTDKDGQHYLRVVDYKTNTHDFSIPKALSGINVQMLLYLFALESANEGGGITPGSVSYTPAKIKNVSSKMPAFLFLAEQHRQRGMIIDDGASLEEAKQYAQAMVEEIKSAVLAAEERARESGEAPPEPPKFLKNDETGLREFMPSEDNTLTRGGYEKLREDCLRVISENVKSLFDGNITARPLKYEETAERKPCDYCRFKSICGTNGVCSIVDEELDTSAYTGVTPEEKDKRQRKESKS